MTLTSTKAHDQFMPVLYRIPQSLTMFGHCLTEVVFTDNVKADKHELQKIFPQLLKDVVPVPEYSVMEPLDLPDDWSVIQLTSTHQVNMRMNIIMNHHTEAKPIIAAFDVQFPVDGATGIRGLVAVIQIAYEKTVYLIQVMCSILLIIFRPNDNTFLNRPARISTVVTFTFPQHFLRSCTPPHTRRWVLASPQISRSCKAIAMSTGHSLVMLSLEGWRKIEMQQSDGTLAWLHSLALYFGGISRMIQPSESAPTGRRHNSVKTLSTTQHSMFMPHGLYMTPSTGWMCLSLYLQPRQLVH